ncbi:hypothetical protein BRADI_4g02952v3 [Brachypodium distachyon]|uniref:Uncharacterized protein n=1 Tax=Brachypodium distachyon TaxID=15368 RepID=A0A2K2CK61_BRADI|nr:hypothetical protein BRADI_4g02952v3 [Brachypodium distachyon]
MTEQKLLVQKAKPGLVARQQLNPQSLYARREGKGSMRD